MNRIVLGALPRNANATSAGGVVGAKSDTAGDGLAIDAQNRTEDWYAPLDALPLPEATQALEVRRLREALKKTRFHQREAAARLGLTYNQFRGYYRKHRDAILNNSQDGG